MAYKDLEKRRARGAEAQRRYSAKAGPEKMAEIQRRHRATLTPEELAERNRRSATTKRLRRETLSPGERASKDLRNRLRQLYGLTVEQFEVMAAGQGGRCRICAQSFVKTPHVDHCHATGKVRGLLCARCNSCLGAVEKPGWLVSAQKYLNEYAPS